MLRRPLLLAGTVGVLAAALTTTAPSAPSVLAIGLVATAVAAWGRARRRLHDPVVGRLLVAAMGAMALSALPAQWPALAALVVGIVLWVAAIGRLASGGSLGAGSVPQLIDAALVAAGTAVVLLPHAAVGPSPAVTAVRVVVCAVVAGLLAVTVLDHRGRSPGMVLLGLSGLAVLSRAVLQGRVPEALLVGSEAAGFVLAAAILHLPAAADLTRPSTLAPEARGRRTMPLLLLSGLVVGGSLADGPPSTGLTDPRAIVGLALAAGLTARFRRLMRDTDEARDAAAGEARRDPLTGLLDRRSAVDALRERMVAGRHAVAVVADVDDFAFRSEVLGPDASDEVLREVADRIRAAAPAGAVVARIAGDVFAVVVDDAVEGAAVEGAADGPADRAIRALHAAANRRPADGRSVPVTAAVGWSTTREPGADCAEVVLRRAVAAVREAKRHGRGHLVAHRPDLDPADPLRARLLQDLDGVAARGELRVELQPLIDLEADALVGFEALLRWDHPELGPVAPDRFIPLAESSGAMEPLGRWVLDAAVAATTALHAELGLPRLAVSVNVSPLQLRDPGFVDGVRAVLDRHGMAAGCLHLEITEGVHLRPGDGVDAALAGLAEQGVRVGLDDFGVGYSSLAYLDRLPLSFVKLDRSLTRRILDGDPIGLTIAAFVRALPHPVVAEGIEEADSCEVLRDLGCRYGQGWALGRPMRPEAIAAWHADRVRALELAPTR